MLVVDAGVLIVAATDDAADGERARARLRNARLAAPELIHPEFLSALRRLERAGLVSQGRAAQAVEDALRLPLRRHSHRPLVTRCWELRANITPYDATYVALAERLDGTLLTTDARLARAPGTRCPIEVLRTVS